MQAADQFMTALTAWRENREGGQDGMQSVINVIINRTEKHNLSPYDVCVQPLQFSSITAKGDPQLNKWPDEKDPVWEMAVSLTEEAIAGTLADITQGATIYYAPHAIETTRTVTIPEIGIVPFPEKWNFEALKYTVSIKNQLFFTEV